jgi:hypothetical protein
MLKGPTSYTYSEQCCTREPDHICHAAMNFEENTIILGRLNTNYIDKEQSDTEKQDIKERKKVHRTISMAQNISWY